MFELLVIAIGIPIICVTDVFATESQRTKFVSLDDETGKIQTEDVGDGCAAGVG